MSMVPVYQKLEEALDLARLHGIVLRVRAEVMGTSGTLSPSYLGSTENALQLTEAQRRACDATPFLPEVERR